MNLPVEVIEAINETRCVLFVGSRFAGEALEAMGREHPDNATLAKALGWKRPKRLPGTRAQRKPVMPSVSEGGRTFAQNHGRDALLSRLEMSLGCSDVTVTEALQTAIRRFPVIFTTNYDDLLERAAEQMGAAAEVRYRGDPIPAVDPQKRVIYKLRGGFEKRDSVVVTHQDFAARPFEVDERKAIRHMFRKSVIFFVGYKPDEEEFELLWQDMTQCYGGELPRCHLSVAQGRIDDYLWQKWVWRGLLMFTADPGECMAELERRLA